MTICATCGAQHREGARFCSECGLPTAMATGGTGGTGKPTLPPLPPEPEVTHVVADDAGPTKQPVTAPTKTALPAPELSPSPTDLTQGGPAGGSPSGRRWLIPAAAVAVVAVLTIVGAAVAFGGGTDGETSNEAATGASTTASSSSEEDEAEEFETSDEPETLLDAANDGPDSGEDYDPDLELEPWYVTEDLIEADANSGSGHAELEARLADPDALASGPVFQSELEVGGCWFATDDIHVYAAVPCDGPFLGMAFHVFEAPDGPWFESGDATLNTCIRVYRDLGLPPFDVTIESLGPSGVQWEEGERTVRCTAVPMLERPE